MLFFILVILAIMIGILGWIFLALVLLRFSKYVGYLVVSRDPGGKTLYTLELNGNPEELATRHHVTFKVVNEPSAPNEDFAN